tara:strand:+ start:2037 stop:3653 length:1617 start_codon:yes stop_codon:yes gene_type:complete
MNENQGKKVRIFHPVLVAIFPILIIYSQNLGKMDFESLFLPIVLAVSCTIVAYFIIKIILKNSIKAAIIVSIILIITFSYGHIYYLLSNISLDGMDIGRTRYLIPIFGVILGIGIFLTIKTKKKLDNATSILNVISVVFVLVAVSNVGFVLLDIVDCEECAKQELFYETMDFSHHFEPHKYFISENQRLPDVYYLILDEYARSDALLDYHEFDNSKFMNYLKDKGFHVAKNNFANYPTSIQSIPAIMNMRYINFLSDEIGTDVRNIKPLNEKDYGLYPNNQVMKNFKEMNYKIITLNTFTLHHHEIPISDFSQCHRTVYLLDNILFDTVARTTVFGYFIERWSEGELRNVTTCAFDGFGNAGSKFKEPVFVWAHIMLPHPPWIWGPNGEHITPGNPLLITENPEYRDSGWNEKLQYTQQVEFANKKTIEAIEKILENNENSIIIIQGDHGTGWDLNWAEPSDDDVWQRLRNFDAIYFPDEEKRILLTDNRTLVNTFRTIFNAYFESEYELLENKLYWGWNDRSYYFEDVTNYIHEYQN